MALPLHWVGAMNTRTLLIELLLSGFFAVACLRASAPGSLKNLFRFPGRIERLRRSRWQWFAMVSLMIVLRLQHQLPLALEPIAVLLFVLFLAIPARMEGADAAAL